MKSLYFLLLIFFLFGFDSPVDDVQLLYQFKVGEEFTWVQSKKQSVKQTVMGFDQEMTNNMHGEYHLKVVEKTATGAKLEVQFTKLKTTSRSLIGQMTMDSHGLPEVSENRFAKAIINKPFYVFVKNRGDVEKIQGEENLLSDLKNIQVSETEKLMLSVFKQFLTEPALKANFKEVFIVYPEKGIKQGDTWKSQMQPGMNFPMLLENTWSVTELLPTVANLSGEGKITTTDKNATVEFAGIKAKANLTGKQTIKTHISLKTGWPSKQDGVADLNGTMTYLEGGLIPSDMEVPVTVHYKSVHILKRKSQEPAKQ